MVTALPGDEVKEILYHAMPNLWRKKMIEQGYIYLDRSIQDISGFFETRVENLETYGLDSCIRKHKKIARKISKEPWLLLFLLEQYSTSRTIKKACFLNLNYQLWLSYLMSWIIIYLTKFPYMLHLLEFKLFRNKWFEKNQYWLCSWTCACFPKCNVWQKITIWFETSYHCNNTRMSRRLFTLFGYTNQLFKFRIPHMG